jgi:uncharacterized protein
MIEGGKLLLAFALGTLPAMLGFAYFASIVSSRMRGAIFRASGLLVLVMGLFMINNGLGLTGYAGNLITGEAQEGKSEPDGFQEIRMDVTASGWSPNSFEIVKGIPVRWIINGRQITNCNNEIVVPELGLQIPVLPGEQVVEFMPEKAGTIRFSCWMGMIPGRFIVVEKYGV